MLEMRKKKPNASAYVFPGPGTSGHITTVHHAHERTIERANEQASKRSAELRKQAENLYPGSPDRKAIEQRLSELEKNTIEHFEFYCWRHTCGTRWAEAGLDRYTVARLMGHSSPRVAERYYIHVTERHVSTGFERFVTYLEGPYSGQDLTIDGAIRWPMGWCREPSVMTDSKFFRQFSARPGGAVCVPETGRGTGSPRRRAGRQGNGLTLGEERKEHPCQRARAHSRGALPPVSGSEIQLALLARLGCTIVLLFAR